MQAFRLPELLACASVSAKTIFSNVLPISLSLTIGGIGGGIFYYFHLPLPWMLGAMIATFAVVMGGAKLKAPAMLRPIVISVIGVMLGSGFDSGILADARSWAVSLAFLGLYLAVASAIVVPYYTHIGKFDRTTAFFAAMPGGVNDMMLIGEAMGADARKIILAHAARILVTIAVIAFWFRVVLGLKVAGFAIEPVSLGMMDVAILTACAVAGVYLGGWLRLPAAQLVGPMILSAIVHIAGVTHSAPPAVLVIIAQVVLGTVLGCRFVGAPKPMVVRSLVLSLGATLLTLTVTLVFAVLFHGLFGQTAEQVILAYAPGGLTEMSLVALSMNAEVAYISVHHLARIALVIAFAPIVMKWLLRRG